MEVTILTPLYNGIEFLLETVDSVIAQTYPHWTMIIGVNGHGDDGGDIGEKVRYIASKDSRIHVIILPSSIKGKSASLNAMISTVHTEWTCILDADDIWLPEKLEKQLQIINAKPHLGVVGTHCTYFGEMTGSPTLVFGEIPRGLTLQYNTIINSSAIFRTKYGRWSTSDKLVAIEDYDLWLHLDYCGVAMYNIPEQLVRHRIHKTSAFNSRGISPASLVDQYKALNWVSTSTTTVVSAFYPLEKSKHGVDRYHSWLQNFCAIPCLLVIYTDEASADLILAARKGLESKTVLIIRPFNQFRMTSPDMMSLWQRHHAIDSEKAIHSPELYAVWAMKQECVRDTIQQNPFNSAYFVWCDVGIQRHTELQSAYLNFPALSSELCKPGRMTFLEVQDIPQSYVDDWKEGLPMKYPPPDVTLGGGCIAGDAAAWDDFGSAYEKLVTEFDHQGRFAGKDQILFFTLLMERRTKLPFQLLKATQFANIPFIYWMSMPCILSGSVPANFDARFEISCSVVLNGRLGNQLFEIAACKAHSLAHHSGEINIIGNLHPYLLHLQEYNRSPSSISNAWREPHYHYASIPSHNDALVGYYQNSKYFSKYAEQIRELLCPRPTMIAEANGNYLHLAALYNTGIAIHVRRGDYQSPQYKTNYGILGREYFATAIQKMRTQNPGGKIVVFSDDSNWCRAEPIFADENAEIIDESNDVIVFTLMSQFKYFILSNSSFSWWPAWLAGESACVLAPEQWYNPSFIANYQDIYEPTWIKIPIGSPDKE